MDRLAFPFVTGAIISAVFILVLRVIIHFPFFDETLHVHYLWLLSSGYKPGTDFYCHYPALAYLFTIPFFKLLPDSAFVVIVLRYISLALHIGTGILFYLHGRKVASDWCAAIIPLILLASSVTIGPFMSEFSIDPFAAAAAVGAMLIYFSPPSERTVAVSAGLSLLSVLITPKYAFPLFFGLIGHIAAYVLASRGKLRTIRAICAGGATSLAFVLIVYWMNGVSFTGNLSSVITTSKTVDKINGILSYSFLIKRLLNKPLFEVVIALGLLGWVLRSRRRIDQITLSGAGILIGLVLFFFTVCLPLEQYQMPVYLSLGMFAPFAFTAFGNGLTVKTLRTCVLAAVFIFSANQFPALLQEFTGTSIYMRDASNPRGAKGPPAVKALSEMDQMLGVIPREDKIVALWFNNPMLRKDLTGITWDERPSYSEALSNKDPNAAFFDPKAYWSALVRHKPALIALDLLESNYPPLWHELTVEFLKRNEASYVKVPSRVKPDSFFYLRRDLKPLP